jgi:hypothetical protein
MFRPATVLRHEIRARYGPILDCEALGGIWVIDTDPGPHRVGVIGIYVCRGRCDEDWPATLSDFTFYRLSHRKGSYSRVSGVNHDGTIMFVGGGGERAFTPRTGTFTPETDHD